jgi:hypothetical protein
MRRGVRQIAMGATTDTVGDLSDDTGPPEASLYTKESSCNTRNAGERGTMTCRDDNTAETRRHDFRTKLSGRAIHGNLKFAGTILAADTVSVRVSHFKGVRSLGDVRSLGHSAALGAEATHAMDWPVIKVPALSRGIYRLQCSRQSIPQRQDR